MGFSGLNWVAIAFLRSRSTSSYKFSTFSLDLVMAQVDRTMQILSGGYLNRTRAIGQDKTR
ncbi:hypothetical protein D0A34_14220 [Microcoleus vaginatus PCC 9802]|uniref:hypothetical protein n=1 Tax=Microcoleus vaginatus TaxID=119532 RepID=UPI00020D2967|nr:hypothetical protein MicvaDRAFT_4104 [Microcoleus vaginatus FGP-2]UNU19875.1 hypothetical protein D0A34_14220 [Microcoleus vaginatus PCC 9802]